MTEAVRLGVIVPSVNIVVEEWYPRVVPNAVSVHFARMLIADGFRLAEPEPDAILGLSLSAWDPQSDGLIAACLNFRSHPIIDALEARIGKPVVTSTQAVLWHLLRLAGVDTLIHGYGRLLREHEQSHDEARSAA